MNLIIDIGNTKVKLATFDGEELRQHWQWDTLDSQKLHSLLQQKKIKHLAISSTKGISKKLLGQLNKQVPVLVLEADTPLPILNRYKTPKTLGKDRLAAVVGAHHLYPRKNCLVIDVGTCITYDLITRKGEYLGGGISPGLDMRLKAMHTFTAKLPLVKRNKQTQLIGNTTVSALRSGALLGAVYEVEGMIAAYRKNYKPIQVLLTGGGLDFFVYHLKTKIFACPHLVRIGLNKILNYNAENKK
ncbi:MAG TPA: type III pantothenate kinase [Phaeodactylibacter sp.]|nr:type III pantothenate kinase [Phaeodactylibacter sp.]